VNRERIVFLKMLSRFLQYPCEDLISSIEEVRNILRDLPASRPKSINMNFLDYLDETPLLSLQEAYTGIFDLNPSTSLNLTYHTRRDGKERSELMIRLKRLYEEAGYEMTTGELPDFLPLILEFMAASPKGAIEWIRIEFGGSVCELTRRLHGIDSPYACLFDILEEIFRNGSGESEPCRAPSENAPLRV
jgi:nitrate reductase delta subunit